MSITDQTLWSRTAHKYQCPRFGALLVSGADLVPLVNGRLDFDFQILAMHSRHIQGCDFRLQFCMKTYPKTRWHRLLYRVLMEWLTPVGIDVKIDVPVSADPPEIDIVLLQTTTGAISRRQKERLADGLRVSKATTLILEFKYTESLNEDAILQTLAYETFYRRIQHIAKDKVDAFLLSSKTPRSETLKDLGYELTNVPGVYRSHYPGLNRVGVLVLNDLSDAPHNIPLKCFASKKNEMRKAHEQIYRNALPGMSLGLKWYLDGLWKLLLNKHIPILEGLIMKQVEKLTAEVVH